MGVRLKKLGEQVIVLTGASSGIGLVTARMAARRGARLVLAARSAEELRRLADEIAAGGGRAVPVVADVAREAEVRHVADVAVERFGGFDTWVNNAGVSVFGRLDDIPIADHRRLFETNFWGTVYGSLAAVRHLRRRGGALVNVGSVASDRAMPLEGMYAASKHAVKGFTDALRMELEKDGAPVAVSLVKPTSIATPLPQHAGNYMATEPTLPAPVYAPELVAEAILHCAEHPTRDLFVGGAAKAMSAGGKYAPRLTDYLMEATMFDQQQTDQPARGDRHGILRLPSHDLRERGEFPRHVFESSVYTKAEMHPLLATAAVVAGGLALGTMLTTVLASDGGRRNAADMPGRAVNP
jgi:short-subunit dehydrogenase